MTNFVLPNYDGLRAILETITEQIIEKPDIKAESILEFIKCVAPGIYQNAKQLLEETKE